MRLIAFLAFFLTISAENSSSVYEVECDYGGEEGYWVPCDRSNYTSCILNHVHIVNNFTKLRILNNENMDYLAFSANQCKFSIFPVEIVKQLPKLSHLRMHRAHMKSIEDFTFANSTNLVHLELDHNELKEIWENTFRGASNLQYLGLCDNLIQYMHPKSFETQTNLKVLDLQKNKLEVINDRIFAPLVNLMRIYLTPNKIREIAPKAFVTNFKAKIFELQKNNFTELELEITSSMRALLINSNPMLKNLTLKAKNPDANIYSIDADYCRLRTIDIDPALKIKKFALEENDIKSLQIIPELPTLQFLHVEKNLLKNLEHINKFPRLIELNVDKNYNINLTPGIFSSLTNLKYLSLSEINMTEFSFDWFGEKLEHLHTLKIDGNQLKELDFVGLDKKFPALTGISINGNEFNCSFLDDMLEYWKALTSIKVLDGDSDADETLNIDGILCIHKAVEEEIFFWEFLVAGLVISSIGIAALVTIGYKRNWKLPFNVRD